MTVKRNDKEVVVTLSTNIDTDELQGILDYLRYIEIASKSKASPSDINKFIKNVKKSRLEKRRKKILSFAGAFSDMSAKDYNSFLREKKKTRLNLFKK